MKFQDDYLDARKAGQRAVRKAQLEGRYPFLPALDDLLGSEGDGLSQVNLGIREVPLDMVVGTKTAGRQNSFANNYMPLLENGTEFASKWDRVFSYQMNVGISDPIKCYEYMKRFYVLEGNKRVSVLKYLDVPSVEAEVIRVLPKRTDDPNVQTYYEFVEFDRICPVYEIDFTRQGEYKEFVELLGLTMDEPWSSDTVHMVEGAYYRFLRAYKEVNPNGIEGMTPADGLLVYLSIYSVQSLIDLPRSTVENRIRRLKEEFKSEINENNIALQKNPTEIQEKNRGFLANFFSAPRQYTEANPLNVAFLYTDHPKRSAWTSDQEIGRIYLNHCFNGLVTTSAYFDCNTDELISEAITKAANAGSDMIVTTSPAMMPRTLRASIHYDKIRFLNMSLNLSHRTVRTYYARMYEAKFLMGAIAALNSENHKVGYVAEHPIYGDIANINAFAIGAALIDPSCKVYLEWATVSDRDWKEAFRKEGISVISGFDYAPFEGQETEHGVYRVNEDGTVTTLASPLFIWGKYYELILRTVINGTYNDDPSTQKNQATNYWYGLSSGVIDVNISEAVPYYNHKLNGILKKGLIRGSILPFSGEIHSQDRMIQGRGAPHLTDDAIIRMDWLNDNVIGHIPAANELNTPAQEVAAVSGVTTDLKKATKVESE